MVKDNSKSIEISKYISNNFSDIINNKEFRVNLAKKLVDEYYTEIKSILLDIDFTDDKEKRLAKTFLLFEVLSILKDLSFTKNKDYEE